MILFFGTRTGKKQSRRLAVNCPFCQQDNSLTYSQQTNYLHLFWIPLLKIGSLQMVQCSHCKKTYLENEFTEAMRNAL
ncbi:MAG: zinc-ribbon domain-containing protein [Flavobacteriaceae bacterium]|nr:zinc-ribbon domain-containing protein [Flavobacteriaceae bacterium]